MDHRKRPIVIDLTGDSDEEENAQSGNRGGDWGSGKRSSSSSLARQSSTAKKRTRTTVASGRGRRHRHHNHHRSGNHKTVDLTLQESTNIDMEPATTLQLQLEEDQRKTTQEEEREDEAKKKKATDDDYRLALKLQEEAETENRKREPVHHHGDAKLAKQLQAQIEKAEADSLKAKEESEKAMDQFPAGRAVRLVEKVLDFVGDFKKTLPPEQARLIDCVAKDDLVFLATNLFERQAAFKEKGIPHKVTIGYHYTTSENMKTIRTTGLLSKADREQSKIKSNYHGSSYGEGIYTANDPISSTGYGNIGLIVVRLPGVEMGYDRCNRSYESGNNSILCNSGNWLVLQKADQCLALIQFDASLAAQLNTGYTRFQNGAKSRSDGGPSLEDLHEKVSSLVEDSFSFQESSKWTFPSIWGWPRKAT